MRVTILVLALSAVIFAVQPVVAVSEVAQAPDIPQVGGPQPGGTVTVTPGGVEQPENVVPQPEQGERVEPVEPAQPPEQPAPDTEPAPPTVLTPELPERTVPRIEVEPQVPQIPEIQPSTPAGAGTGPTITTEPIVTEGEEIDMTIVDDEDEFGQTAIPRAGVNLAWVSIAGALLTGAGLAMRRMRRGNSSSFAIAVILNVLLRHPER